MPYIHYPKGIGVLRHMYKKVKKTSESGSHELNVYLGTIPDYASSAKTGVKLSGVSKDSPADRSALRANDIIIELAGKKIHDVAEYALVLNTLQIGKPVTVVVMRAERRLQFKIVPTSRG